MIDADISVIHSVRHEMNEAISRSSHCSTTGVPKVVACAILSGMLHVRYVLLLIGKSSP